MLKNLPNKILNDLNQILKKNDLTLKIIVFLLENGGKVFLVGGAVRDLLLEIPVKDLDIEIHNIESKTIENIFRTFGEVNFVGKAFGVYRVQGIDIDWSLPRTDTAGRKPDVKIDAQMGIKEALKRRDLTINAMAIDLQNKQLIDPFNGYEDLKNKILRATDSNFFIEDPLRFYRVMQFIGRFQMQPVHELNETCKKMEIKNVSIERIEQEFRKLFLKSKSPSLGIDWLRKINRLNEVLPELNATIDVPQEPTYHPEGDVYEHSLQALDAAVSLNFKSDDEKFMIMLAALCHDLGKTATTELFQGKYRSHRHEQFSEIFARKMLKRITKNLDLIDAVCKLVKYHMQPIQFIINNAKPAAYKRLAAKLAPNTNLLLLAKLMEADNLGRNPQKGKPLQGSVKEVEDFLNKIKELAIETKPEEPILKGRDLINIIKPGPKMGELLKIAYAIQLDEGIKDKNELLKRIL